MTIIIPEHFVWMAKNSSTPRKSYRRYINAYLEHNYPDYRLIDYHQRTAEIEKVTQ
ncbi:hypothetical protein SAMN05518684_106228 [Salipaludibacillus aurantiacus]|uniref:Uncharacterized protein n=1 Tax=Salipaludibacillus aurantiacus TaxID=1601833 RepID=A0A1H9U1F9_9BACI|nr:hypothetical protein SAMN05518684_106228 [Salipaludibacillus aurantiacus]